MKSYLTEYPEGNKYWKNKAGKLHRENGPAVEYANGFKLYYINGRNLTPEQFKKYVLKKRLKELI